MEKQTNEYDLMIAIVDLDYNLLVGVNGVNRPPDDTVKIHHRFFPKENPRFLGGLLLV